MDEILPSNFSEFFDRFIADQRHVPFLLWFACLLREITSQKLTTKGVCASIRGMDVQKHSVSITSGTMIRALFIIAAALALWQLSTLVLLLLAAIVIAS